MGTSEKRKICPVCNIRQDATAKGDGSFVIANHHEPADSPPCLGSGMTIRELVSDELLVAEMLDPRLNTD